MIGETVFFDIVKPALVDGVETGGGGGAQGGEFGGVLLFALFEKAQAFAQDLAGILIAPACNEGFDNFLVPLGENDVARGHGGDPACFAAIYSMIGRICHAACQPDRWMLPQGELGHLR
jgi:hypothetical protein